MFKITGINHNAESLREMELAVERSKEAQAIFSKFSQDEVDQIVKEIAEAGFKESGSLARIAVDETGMGVYEHKVIKNEHSSMGVYESIKEEKTVGVIKENFKEKITEIAYPFGVIAAICPTTNPTSTAVFKTLIALKSQNGIVVSPHPSAKKCTVRALEVCRDAAVAAGAPDGLIGWVTNPTMDATTELMQHKDIDLILATGGGGLVKAAYSSGKPAYGVGPGNGPVYLEKTANVKKAVKLIVDSKTFDNGTLCSTEQSIVVHQNIKVMALRELKKNGAYLLNSAEKVLIENVISPTKGQLNPKIVGRSAKVIAGMAGITIPSDVRLLIAEEDRIAKDVPFSIEKLSPIFPIYTVNSEEEAHKVCTNLLNLNGRGHSCTIHSNDDEAIRRYGMNMPVSRIIVNTYASIGAAGATTGLVPSMTLGCGSYGGNISSDNITAHHLYNIKRIAYGIKELSIPKPLESNESKTNSFAKKNSVDLDDSNDVKEVVRNVLSDARTSPRSMDQAEISKVVENVIKEMIN